MSMIVDRRQLSFLLYDFLDLDGLLASDRHADWDRAGVEQIFDTAQKIAEGNFLPIAAIADQCEPRFEDGRVVMHDGVAEAIRAQGEAGFFSLGFDADDGGLQAPWVVHMAASGMFTCANTGVANYAFLTVAAANLLAAFGSDDLKARFLPNMLAGRWFGTMCLSEPQAGSSLGDITTRAVPRGDGTYAVTGSKMWISGGDHDLADNIAHFVLAKIPGGPAGSKGISLFLVPKRRVDADGRPGADNHIVLAGLNHKLGQRATTNCLLNFGEGGESIGYLIGEEHRGLAYMFHMMNDARIGVGYASAMQGLGGYLYSADYAQTRLQGRPLADRNPATQQVPIIQHPDVRRMLLAQKTAVEGAQALCLYAASLVDQTRIAGDDAARQANMLLGLLTPVVKSWPSEHCLEANKWAIQVLGGYGYTIDYPVERLYRDNRLNHIHEGTFAIQGIDLVGRKIMGEGGQSLALLCALIDDTIQAAPASLAPEAAALSRALDLLNTTVSALRDCDDEDLRLANATLFLDAFGSIVIGWIWLRLAILAAGKDDPFHAGKITCCRYFFRYMLPPALADMHLVGTLDPTCRDAGTAIFAQA